MRAIVILLLAASLFPVYGSARMGETRKQCEKRYGEPVEQIKASDFYGIKIGDGFKYRKAGFEISIIYTQGKAGLMIFKNMDGAGGYRDISVDEIEILLKANSAGQRWYGCTDSGNHISIVCGILLEPGENNNGWIRADCARAVYDHSRKALIIMSDEYNQSYYKKIDGDLTDL